MDDMDKLLNDAGQRWRAGQPPAATFDPASLARADSSRAPRLIASFAAGVAGAAMVIAVVAVGIWVGMWPGGEMNVGTAPSQASTPIQDNTGCAVTRPDPVFVPPSPYPAEAPPLYESDWYGSEALWTMLDRDGEMWGSSAINVGEKTFWWSLEWPGMRDDPAPALTVVGTRLDGPGTFTAGPATNAGSDDFGEAMLVGVEIPTAGCWQLTASYGEATLSYVVSVTDK